MLQANYERGTKDSDIFETHNLPITVKDELPRLAGCGTKLAQRHRMYVEFVSKSEIELPGWLG